MFVKPAVAVIQPFLYTTPTQVDVHVHAWHGVTPELLMTIGIVVVGLLLFLTLSKWQKVYKMIPESLSLNKLYDFIMDVLLITAMERFSNLYMTGSIRKYLTYMFTAIVSIVIATLFIKDAFIVSFENVSPITVYEVILIIVLSHWNTYNIICKITYYGHCWSWGSWLYGCSVLRYIQCTGLSVNTTCN